MDLLSNHRLYPDLVIFFGLSSYSDLNFRVKKSMDSVVKMGQVVNSTPCCPLAVVTSLFS